MHKMAGQPDRTRPLPLYFQLYEILREHIVAGQWPPGERLPPIPDLAAQFKVASVTVRQAIKLLANDGLLIAERGRGTTVLDRPSQAVSLHLESSVSHLLDIYAQDRPALENLDEGIATPLLEHDFQDRLAGSYYHIKRAHLRDGLRYCIISFYLAEAVFRRREHAFRTRLALAVLSEMPELEMKRAWQKLTIERADHNLAAQLNIARGEPIARLHRYITNRQAELIYFADVRYRSDCVQYNMELKIDPH